MELWNTFVELVLVLGRLLIELLQVGLRHGLVLFVLAWCLFAINWRKMWPTLAAGAWVPLTLLLLVAAFVWSQILPSKLEISPTYFVPNFWWQLGAVGLMTGIGLFCGWLQGHYGWYPQEVSVEPPAHGHGHGHGHDHHTPDSHAHAAHDDAAHASAHDAHGHH